MKFEDISIQRKVSAVVVAIPVLTLLVATIGYFFIQQASFKSMAETELEKLAEMVAISVPEAVVGFEPQPQEAARALDVLRSKSEIREAHIFTSIDSSRPFASTPREALPPEEVMRSGNGYYRNTEGLWLLTQLKDERGRVFGRVAIFSTLSQLKAQQHRSLVWFALTALLALAWSIALSIWLGRALSGPLVHLARRMKEIESSGDQSIRMPEFGADEVGKLAKSVNRMLDAISMQRTALLESEERLKLATSAAHIGIWDWDVVSDLLVWDEATYRIFGVVACDETRLEDLWLSRVRAEDRDRLQKELHAALETQGRFNSEFQVAWPDGTVRYVTTEAQAFRNSDGKVVRMVGVNYDVTDAKRAEQEKQKLQGRLAQSQKMEALGTLAGGIAHDFNNLLTSILGNAELARLEASSEKSLLVSLDGISKAGHRARDLVQGILAFSRPTEPVRTPLLLKPVVEEVFRLLRSTLPASVELELDAANDTPLILADASQVHQVIMNLATNSWHALEGRTGVIKIDIRHTRVDTRLSELTSELHRGEYALLSVSDNGKGMDNATQARIFEPFFTTKPVGKGTGLGLSMVHGIMRAHEGAVTVESAPGKGAIFNLYFPAATDPSTLVPVESDPAVDGLLNGRGQHILYLDDEDYMVHLVQRILIRLGYRVSTFSTVPAAIEAFTAAPESFDLIVTDMNMPVMSGLDFAEIVFRIRKTARVVLVSGHLRQEEIEYAERLGIEKVIDKPSSIEGLGTIMARLFS